jgi:hypothetical protein
VELAVDARIKHIQEKLDDKQEKDEEEMDTSTNAIKEVRKSRYSSIMKGRRLRWKRSNT